MENSKGQKTALVLGSICLGASVVLIVFLGAISRPVAFTLAGLSIVFSTIAVHLIFISLIPQRTLADALAARVGVFIGVLPGLVFGTLTILALPGTESWLLNTLMSVSQTVVVPIEVILQGRFIFAGLYSVHLAPTSYATSLVLITVVNSVFWVAVSQLLKSAVCRISLERS